ncbi:hypothetical protein Amsp01_068410 [Amycolatopsis sp. NBRC 101858]|uniref:hypothetical protein n=1 Tax=Amycolatopsis sp. NBRC 101858 TaxID=3032200 RepID=UPI0024A1072A|nr:hypothetical protein [Amycolatopsis sp. NBRC 101858]GLY40818.1 hypothetical protein Amsp01_068410 [Amycolatopsis sp. NBRC 101858]
MGEADRKPWTDGIRPLLVIFGVLAAVFGAGSAISYYSGSATSAGTVERITGWSTASVRVDEPGGSRVREVRIANGNTREYAAGTRIGVRYWPDGEHVAVDTVHEPPLVALVTFGTVLLVIGGFALKAWLGRLRSRRA